MAAFCCAGQQPLGDPRPDRRHPLPRLAPITLRRLRFRASLRRLRLGGFFRRLRLRARRERFLARSLRRVLTLQIPQHIALGDNPARRGRHLAGVDPLRLDQHTGSRRQPHRSSRRRRRCGGRHRIARRSGCRGRARGRGRPGRSRRIDAADHRADGDARARLDLDGQNTGGRGELFLGRLVGFQLADRLAGLHRCPIGLEPLQQRCVSDRLARWCYLDFDSHALGSLMFVISCLTSALWERDPRCPVSSRSAPKTPRRG